MTGWLRSCFFAAMTFSSGISTANASSYSTIYSFPPMQVGITEALVAVNLVAGPNGTLFGITYLYGSYGEGSVFELSPPAVAGAQWNKTTIASFANGGPVGENPQGIAVGRDGAVYVTTYEGSGIDGAALKFTPPAVGQTAWTQTVLYKFVPTGKVGAPEGQMYVDSSGVVFGPAATTFNSANSSDGAIYRLAPPFSGSGRDLISTLFTFPRSGPYTGLTRGGDGAFYGADTEVWRLRPPATGQAGPWVYETLVAHATFLAAGNSAPPVADRGLDLFGAATYGGRPGKVPGNPKNGFIYKVAPPAVGQTAWTISRLYLFNDGADGVWPNGVVEGPNGLLYGTAASGSDQPRCPPRPRFPNDTPPVCGVVFSLVPHGGMLPWKEVLLHTFGSPPDGATPSGNLVRGSTTDGKFALFGATINGGAYGLGTIYEIIP